MDDQDIGYINRVEVRKAGKCRITEVQTTAGVTKEQILQIVRGVVKADLSCLPEQGDNMEEVTRSVQRWAQ